MQRNNRFLNSRESYALTYFPTALQVGVSRLMPSAIGINTLTRTILTLAFFLVYLQVSSFAFSQQGLNNPLRAKLQTASTSVLKSYIGVTQTFAGARESCLIWINKKNVLYEKSPAFKRKNQS